MISPVNLSLDVTQSLPAAIELSMHLFYVIVVMVSLAAISYSILRLLADILEDIDLKPVFMAIIAFALVGIYLKM